MTDFHIIIPARYQSSRLPGKPLLDIKGKSLLERVYERAMLCGAQSVTIATDDERIENAARQFGAAVCFTSLHHPTGTDRLAEAVEILNLVQNPDAIVVNLQGDEPLVPIACIHTIVKSMHENPKAFMTTICSPILNAEHLRDPNVVKVVLDRDGFALYFSRSLLPYPREAHSILDELLQQQQEPHFYRHIGLFAYRARSLKHYQTLTQPLIEKLELIEALRILWHGEQIHVSVVPEPLPPGVDTLAELEHMRSLFS